MVAAAAEGIKKKRGGNIHIMLVEVLQHPFPLREDEFPAEVLSVVSAPFPQKPLSVACQEGIHEGPTLQRKQTRDKQGL